jgi:hypothetical protein
MSGVFTSAPFLHRPGHGPGGGFEHKSCSSAEGAGGGVPRLCDEGGFGTEVLRLLWCLRGRSDRLLLRRLINPRFFLGCDCPSGFAAPASPPFLFSLVLLSIGSQLSDISRKKNPRRPKNRRSLQSNPGRSLRRLSNSNTSFVTHPKYTIHENLTDNLKKMWKTNHVSQLGASFPMKMYLFQRNNRWLHMFQATKKRSNEARYRQLELKPTISSNT